MTENLLVEIGLEEMPAHVVDPSILQFEEKKRNNSYKKITWTLLQ